MRWALAVLLASLVSAAPGAPQLDRLLRRASEEPNLRLRLDLAFEAYLIAKKEGPGDQLALSERILGTTYSRLGDQKRAAIWYERAYKHAQSPRGKGAALNNLAITSLELGRFEEALAFAQASLPFRLEEAKSDPMRGNAGLGSSYNQIAQILDGLGRANEARDAFGKSLTYRLSTLDSAEASLKSAPEDPARRTSLADARARAAGTLQNLGSLLFRLGKREEARELLLEALAMVRGFDGPRQLEADIIHHLARSVRAETPELAIALWKESVNLLQENRRELIGLKADLRATYTADNSEPYRDLADALIAQGRIGEALKVMDMLKEAESFAFLRSDPGSFLDRLERSLRESGLWDRWMDVESEAGRIAFELRSLERKNPRTATEEAALAKLRAAARANAEAMARLFALIAEDTQKSNAPLEATQVGELQTTIERVSRDLGRPVAAVRLLVGDGAIHAVLVTSDHQQAFSRAIDAKQLRADIATAALALRTPDADPRPATKAIFDRTLRLVEPELKRRGIHDLVCSLDDSLRYLPLAALHDGKGYLIERYRITYFSPVRLGVLERGASNVWSIAGFAAPNAKGYSELRGAAEEVDEIVLEPGGATGILKGSQYIGDAFTPGAFESSVRSGNERVLHLATHFVLRADAENSFLVTGRGADEVVSVGAMAAWKSSPTDQIFRYFDLLYLSACDTAVPSAPNSSQGDSVNGAEVDSLADFALGNGAATVVASLWPLDDRVAALTAKAFYGRRTSSAQQGLAECFRQAQLAVMNTSAEHVTPSARAGSTSSAAATLSALPKFEADPKKPFAHPYYWAPLLVFGAFR